MSTNEPTDAPPTPVDTCGRCGRHPATGLATIGIVRLCHGDDDAEPTCYQLQQQEISQTGTFMLRLHPRTTDAAPPGGSMKNSGVFTQSVLSCPACGRSIGARFSYDLALDKAVANMKDALSVPANVKVTGMDLSHNCIQQATR